MSRARGADQWCCRPSKYCRVARPSSGRSCCWGWPGSSGPSRLAPASAATIDNAITSVNIKQASAGPNTPMELDMTWAVPDSANSGDTFTLDLPGELKANTTSFVLKAPDGSIVANAVVVNGVVTFTLTDYVDIAQRRQRLGVLLGPVGQRTDSRPTGPYDLDFKAGSKVFHDTVNKTGVTPVNRTEPAQDRLLDHPGHRHGRRRPDLEPGQPERAVQPGDVQGHRRRGPGDRLRLGQVRGGECP